MKRMLIAAGVAFGVMATLIPVRAEDGSKENYLTRCASCHGAGGWKFATCSLRVRASLSYQCASKASRTSVPKTVTVKGQMTEEMLRKGRCSWLMVGTLDTKSCR